jgi:hypothetical protein
LANREIFMDPHSFPISVGKRFSAAKAHIAQRFQFKYGRSYNVAGVKPGTVERRAPVLGIALTWPPNRE